MKIEAVFRLLGKYFNYCIGNGDEKIGRLIQIKIDSNERIMVGIDEDGFIEEYEISDIIIKNNTEGNIGLVRQIIKQVNKNINAFKFDLAEYRRDDFLRILQEIEDENIRREIADAFNLGAALNVYDEVIDKILNINNVSDEDKDLLCGVIAYKQHDNSSAYKIFSKRWLKKRNDPDTCRDFILVADEFDNDVLCFYLLKDFFRKNRRYVDDRYYITLWWKYLFYAVKYNNFDLLMEMNISEWNVRRLLDSYIYIFNMYNMGHLAIRLVGLFVNGNNTILQGNNEDLGNVQNTIDEINLLKNYLPDTVESYYLRFESCMKRILQCYTENKKDDSEEEKSGYIYEYVESRNYGFIIGMDFQKYFYHRDYLSLNLRKRVMDNIYSKINVETEDKLFVQFRSERSNKKIQAIDII